MANKRKLGRATPNRKAMLRAMVTFFLEKGEIKTTITRAKEVRSIAEKIITRSKNPTLSSKRKVMEYITKEDVVKKVFDEISPKYANVNGGYTRIFRLSPRRGDAAKMAKIQLV